MTDETKTLAAVELAALVMSPEAALLTVFQHLQLAEEVCAAFGIHDASARTEVMKEARLLIDATRDSYLAGIEKITTGATVQ
jgi:hypothetical protein